MVEHEIRSKYTLRLLAGILLITFLVYLPSLQNGFTNWDDPDQVLENTDVHQLSAAGTMAIFSSFYVGMYQPLTSQVYAVVYQIFGPEATAFHSLSLLIHLLNVLLVFMLVRQFVKRDGPALVTAALFALNPMQTESVAWISATSNLLYTAFFLAGLITYLRYIRTGHIKQLIFTLLLFMLSLLSKPSAVTFPVIMLLADLYFRRKFDLKLILEKIPFLICALAIGLLTIYAREEAGHIIDITERFGWSDRILMVFYALAFYITRLFSPTGLSAFHPYPLSGLTIEYYIAPLVIIMLVFLVFRLRGEQKRQVLAGLLFFFFSIAVTLEIIPVGVQVVKERYVYLPSIGLYFVFAVLMFYLFVRKKRWITPVLTVVMMALFSILTLARSATWIDSMTLWNDILDSYPEASAPLINRGNTWQESGDMSRAITDYSMAIVFEPGAADAYLNRGLAYYKLEKTEQALNDFDMAISLGADDASSYNYRGLLWAAKGQFENAISDFRLAIERDASHLNARINLGLMYANLADYPMAYEALSNAIAIDQHAAKAYYWRGMVLLQMKRFNETCDDMRAAVSNGWPADQVPEFCK